MLTEDEFLKALFKRLPIPPAELVIPPGDDCAGLRIGRGRILLVAIDQVVGGRHYLLEGPGSARPEEIGRKLLARNLSDIAAMGGRPLYCLVASAFSPRRGDAWLQKFFDGIVTTAREFGVFMIGGDLAVTPADDTASLVILGEATEKKVVRRSGARPGDVLFSTGCFGRAVASRHHLLFMPRCREGEWLASKGYARAMIDVSDGLLLDARRLCRSSRMGLRLKTEAIPLRSPGTSLREALTDGEDYELLFAVAKRKAGRLLTEWPFRETPLTIIGEFIASDTPVIGDSRGHLLAFEGADGFDHFTSLGDGGGGGEDAS
jgi:thiamine-monophosphate kinase